MQIKKTRFENGLSTPLAHNPTGHRRSAGVRLESTRSAGDAATLQNLTTFICFCRSHVASRRIDDLFQIDAEPEQKKNVTLHVNSKRTRERLVLVAGAVPPSPSELDPPNHGFLFPLAGDTGQANVGTISIRPHSLFPLPGCLEVDIARLLVSNLLFVWLIILGSFCIFQRKL